MSLTLWALEKIQNKYTLVHPLLLFKAIRYAEQQIHTAKRTVQRNHKSPKLT